jgi:hypothetical protein
MAISLRQSPHLSTAVPACEQQPGIIYPVVDLKRCEGCGFL